ncbi:MAG: Smr/MutS family protein, partial [Paludibacteraceae bacterium]|nr:Smr/MutS family protein [Paludibacteraceae bacterium]
PALTRKIEKIAGGKKKEKPKQQFDKEIYKVGDNVRLKGQHTVGVILEIQDKNATVAFGQLKMNAKLSNLEKLSNNQVKKEQRQVVLISSSTRDEIRRKKLNFKQEIDVRGMRGDEALQAVMYFIDDALTVGVSQVRILHGTGTGALREVIRQYLSTVSGVTHFHDEHVQLGGSGITVVEM